MTPAKIEAEARRLFAAWAAPQAYPLDFDLLGEMMRAPWLAVAKASLQARAEVTAERDFLKRREQDIIAACERVADGGQYRADVVSAIQRLRCERDEVLAAARALLAFFGASDFSFGFGIPAPEPGRLDAYSGGIPPRILSALVPLLRALRASAEKAQPKEGA